MYQQLALFFNLDGYNLNFHPEYDIDLIQTYLDELEQQYNIEPEDALFDIKNNKVQAFKIEKNGRHVDSMAAITELKQKIYSLDLK